MAERARHVGVVERDAKIHETYVFEGTQTFDEVFTFINEHHFPNLEVTGISVHLDRSTQLSFVEKFSQQTRIFARQS